MNSRIYTGKVMHARLTPVRHSWVFPFYFYAIDLDELPELDRTVRGFGFNRWNPVSLRDTDYLRGSGVLRERLAEFIDTSEIDRIVLVTVARFMAKVFNPVSFYYGLKKDGSPACMVTEVNNTFSERHLYILEGGAGFPLKCTQTKGFHVSPFNDMHGHYEFVFSAPGEDINIEIRLVRNEETVMNAAMWGKGRPLTTAHLWQTVLKHPFTAALTMPRILWQAALLRYKKKLPVFSKPAPSSPMTIKAKI
jgi:cyclopropane-fatty-acyl-phospholipid synthase